MSDDCKNYGTKIEQITVELVEKPESKQLAGEIERRIYFKCDDDLHKKIMAAFSGLFDKNGKRNDYWLNYLWIVWCYEEDKGVMYIMDRHIKDTEPLIKIIP